MHECGGGGGRVVVEPDRWRLYVSLRLDVGPAVELFGPRILSTRPVFVVDMSGSMQSERIESLRRAME